ncbi:helix-turn-helix transcriptional regulator [Nocardia yunnanensis]|uniref:Helix-turn-helix transcriptional regulator n=1 Tax=Nocardia yunnanensis TaxID=2382165 RepID=A0A386ZM52_9NOCA|nr:LuxR family transcriptional regulator [Nocardia yunnanensis]AYF78647.1 helix-turn-helix transcriptional regulator [Nocardia yunnanensis]
MGEQPPLRGREQEQRTLAALIAGARAGDSGVLVLRGEPGIGKTALLDHAAAGADGLRLLRGTGIEAEAELPYAGLQLLLGPALDRLAGLPGPQQAALAGALGLATRAPGPGPGGGEPMLTGLAVLSLLTDYAEGTGLLVVVDDAQWLDRASQDALQFAARRLRAEGVAMLFGVREGEGSFEANGLPQERLSGLSPEASAALLDEHPLTPAVRYRLLAEARGNPLALRELPLAMAAEPTADLSAGALPLTDRLRLAFHGRISHLPEATTTALTIMAIDESCDLPVILRAAAALGAGIDDLAPAEAAGLLHRVAGDADRITFRHPLIRAAVHQRAPLGRRMAVHRALAAAMDAPEQADRRAWHLAAAALGPDAEVADALERTAVRARERGGFTAAAAAYDRAARLSVAPADRTRRQALAAQACLEAGEPARAGELARRTAREVDSEALRANLTQVRALAEFWQGEFTEAHRLLVDAATGIGATHPAQAADMLVQAMHTGWYLGDTELREVLKHLAELPLSDDLPVTPVVRFLGGLFDRGPRDQLTLDRILDEIRTRGAVSDQVLLILCGIALARGQDGPAFALATALAAEHRAAGAAGRLPTILFFTAETDIFTGRLRDARTTAVEARDLARDTGQQQWVRQLSSVLAHLDALHGNEDDCRAHADLGLTGDTPDAIAPGAPWAHWSLGLLDLGAGRAEAALSRFERLTKYPFDHHICAMRSIPDLVEAAVRIGAPDRAAAPFENFRGWAESAGQPWADALVLRCRALLDDRDAEDLYARALATHDREARPIEFARTALLFGEWLRRARRKSEARTRLLEALEVFDRLEMGPWAARARHELTAAGAPEADSAPARRSDTGLTPQELQIVRLAAQGLSNRDIAAQLFLSHRTVGYHLYKAYPKLGVVSRGELKGIADQLN